MINFESFANGVVSFSGDDINESQNINESAQLVRSAGYKTAKPPRTYGDVYELIKNQFDEIYTEDGKWSFKQYQHRTLYITDLENALQTGKKSSVYAIHAGFGDDVGIYNAFSDDTLFSDVIKMLSANKTENESLKVRVETVRSIDLFSPFAISKLKRLTSIPSRITIPHVIKLIANGQFKYLGRDYRHTDDYAYDSASNFGKIESGVNPIKLVEDMVGGRWKAYISSDNTIHFGPHSNESWTLVPDLNAKLRLRV